MEMKQTMSKVDGRRCSICTLLIQEDHRDFIFLPDCHDLFHINCLLELSKKFKSPIGINHCPDCNKPFDISCIKKPNDKYSDRQVMCCIDYELFTDDRIPYSLPCNHFFHFGCLNTWRNSCQGSNFQDLMNRCPLCKQVYQQSEIKSRVDFLNSKITKVSESQLTLFSKYKDKPLTGLSAEIKKGVPSEKLSNSKVVKDDEKGQYPEINIRCKICNFSYKERNLPYMITPCSHCYHFDCLSKWRTQAKWGEKNKCPTCKKIYSEDQIIKRVDLYEKIYSSREGQQIGTITFTINYFSNSQKFQVTLLPTMTVNDFEEKVSEKAGIPQSKLEISHSLISQKELSNKNLRIQTLDFIVRTKNVFFIREKNC